MAVDMHIRTSGSGGPLILTGTFENNADALFANVRERVGDCPFTLCQFILKDWMNGCAPWPAQVRGENINGLAPETLGDIKREILPALRDRGMNTGRIYITGYSMAGLLAIWAMYVEDIFSGCATCSGSLWYPGWDRFIGEQTIATKSANIYISLGGKEPRTRDPMMAMIGVRTEENVERLKHDRNVNNVFFEWNPGGHFSAALERLAKGIAWLILHDKE